MAKNKNLKNLEVSPYCIAPVCDSPIDLMIKFNTTDLAYLKLNDNNSISITMTDNFEDWYFSAKASDKDEFLFSIMLAEGIMNAGVQKIASEQNEEGIMNAGVERMNQEKSKK